MSIGHQIEHWFESQGRDLPWRETKDPYRIWISEVILQQTRIAQGIKYYYRFIERFPDVQSLARAEQDEVLKYWEGLGYYSRARNLHAASKQIVNDYNGEFPDHYTELMKLKGIGPYTARAIGSFAFGNQTGVIDGNVLRVMSRVLGDFSPINQQSTKKKFQEIIDSWVKGTNSKSFNNGIMDLGSVVCTPTQPGCLICPLVDNCKAYKEGLIHVLPFKEKKKAKKVRYFHFYIVNNSENEIAIRQRPDQGLWGGLWEIPNEEVSLEDWQNKKGLPRSQYHHQLKHVFTHFEMMINVFTTEDSKGGEWNSEQFISPEKISIFAFSKAVLKIFDKWQNTD